jgi:isopenicillin N synthase-like dioxygenase
MVFYEVSREVGKAVARIIALALGLDANFFDKPETLGEPIAIVRMLHYQGIELVVFFGALYTWYNYKLQNVYYCIHNSSLLSCREDKISDPSQGLYAAGAHTDYGLITLLATDDVQGLQVRMQLIFLPICH